LNKIESLKLIRGVIRNKSQIEGLKHNWPKLRRLEDDCSSSSSRGCSSDLLPKAFDASFIHQIGQKLYENDHLTPDYTPV
jgi:hypothetical protein